MKSQNTHDRQRILLVDDHIESIVSVARLLTGRGYHVRMAFNGIEAVSTAVAFRPDVAFIDLTLPLLDGFGVAKRLRAMAETRHATLIALTGWSADEVQAQVHEAGFDLYLVKPLSFDALLAALTPERANTRSSLAGGADADVQGSFAQDPPGETERAGAPDTHSSTR